MSLIPELKHHSASSIASFLENRSEWFAGKVLGKKFEGNIHTLRGHAIELGINEFLNGLEPKEAAKKAVEHFNNNRAGMTDYMAHLQSITPGVLAACTSFEERYGMFDIEQQAKINLEVAGISRPVIGYLDYLIVDKKVIDNKVTSKTPSELSMRYKIQGALYKQATGLDVEFHFEVMLKGGVNIKVIKLEHEDYLFGMKWAKHGMRAIEDVWNNLERFDFDTLRSFFLPSPSAYYNAAELKTALEVFQLE